MKNTLFLILFAQLSMIPSYAQHFVFHSNSPYGIQLVNPVSERSATNIFFFDYDFDGDQDLFLTGFASLDQVEHPDWSNVHFFMEYQENTGDKWNPVFAERSNIFDAFPYPVGYFVPAPGDLNNDHITDFIVGAEIDFFGSQTLIQHLGNGPANDFTSLRLDSAGLYSFVAESFYAPNLVDLDLDGDLDLILSGFDPAFGEENDADTANFYYAKNIGSKTSPSFLGWYSNPYGLLPNPFAEVLASGDLDNDKDVDFVGATMFVTSDSSVYIYVHLNNPEPGGRPFFDTTLTSPFGLPADTGEVQFLSPNLVDLNGDGDLDFFVLEANSDTILVRYYENNLCIVDNSDLLTLLCEGDAFHIGDNTYTDPGFYTVHLQGSDGCDSIIALTIELIQPTEHFINESICEGESFTVGNETFTTSGDYMVYIVAANGCDSIVFLSLVIDPLINVSFNLSMCEGETIIIYNETFTKAGDYSLIVPAAIGCDTMVQLSLIVIPHAFTSLDETICDGEIYTVGNESFSVSGNYVVMLVGANGCDSVVTLNLQVNEVDNTVSVNQNTISSNVTGAAYQWFDCDSGENIPGATNQSYEVTVTGNYAVHISLSGCLAVSECISIIISGTEEDRLSNTIKIYPNPATGLFQVLNNTSFPLTSLAISNLSGQPIVEFSMDGKTDVDISFIGNGVYLVKMKIGEFEIIKKLVVI